MKKILSVLMLLLLCVLAACSSQDENMSIPEPPENGASAEAQATDAVVADENLVDLTQLSSTMVYVEVYNMMITPENYFGKTIKMRGMYYASHDAEADIYYHYALIQDAAACCAQGLEFIRNGEYAYPDDYPADETMVEICGIWSSYEENGRVYYYIAAADMTVL